MKVVVTGGTGFVGRALVRRLLERKDDVVVLTRDARRAAKRVDPRANAVDWGGADDAWEAAVAGADAVLNLAGENLARRWTAAAKQKIRESRLNACARLHAALAKSEKRPDVVVSASAVGWYGSRGDEELTEESPRGTGFLADLAADWEAAAARLGALGPRVVCARTGVVLARDGGALAKMIPPFKLFVGGRIGSGRQWMSWIHREDLVELLLFALKTPSASGAINATSPNPARNADFATSLGKALQRPAFVPAPAALVRLALGEMSSVVLEGQKVLPKRALELGFAFRHADLDRALSEAVRA